jgi:GTPase SAR1 family protein
MKYKMNVLLLGNKKVGKTTYIDNILNGNFISEYVPTNKCNNFQIILNTNIEDFIINVYDISSEIEDLSTYLDIVNAIYLMYDLSDMKSFVELKKWYDMISKFNVPIFVIGNKYDIKDNDLEKFSKAIIKMKKGTDKHWFISNKTGYNIYEPFLGMVRTLKNDKNIKLKTESQELNEKTNEEELINLFQKTDSILENIEVLNVNDLTCEDFKNIIEVLKECRDKFIEMI